MKKTRSFWDIHADILRRARTGELTPEAAENEAAQARLGPLAKSPSQTEFDPMKMTYWTLAMALAWAVWRSPAKVREYCNDHRRGCYDWVQQDGWHLRQRKTIEFIDVWTEASNAPIATVEKDRLWELLLTGQLKATGIPLDQVPRIPIPQFEWNDLSKINFYGREDESVGTHGGKLRYNCVLVAKDDVLKLWPKPTSTAKAGSDCRAFLLEKMRASPHERTHSKGELWEACKALFPRLSERQFDLERKLAIEAAHAPAWKRSGRFKKIKSPHQEKS